MSLRNWTQITVPVPGHAADPVSDFLSGLTGRGVSIREEGDEILIDAYLPAPEAEDGLLAIQLYLDGLADLGILDRPAGVRTHVVPEEDWMAVFRSQHAIVRISDRLVVRPTWCEPLDGREMVLDPGMAFGTGSHATTRLCLALLDGIVGSPPPARMLDLGTGSGILAIAGAILGVPEVVALDIDPVAVQVARENAGANRVMDRIRFVEGGIEAAEGIFQLIAANLSGSLLIRLAQAVVQRLAPGGSLILSGVMTGERTKALSAYESLGLSVDEVLTEDVWITALLHRKGEAGPKWP